MASIRRSLSPYHDRSHTNGGSPFSVNSPSHKNANRSSSYSLSRFLAALSLQRHSRKAQPFWRKSLFRCLILFMLGFLLGLAPFNEVDVVSNHDFTFEIIKPPPVNVIENDVVMNHPVQLGERKLEKSVELVYRKELIVVTPTYNRALQAYYLGRLGNLLRLVPPPLIWIVVEMNEASMETAEILRNTGVMYRHLVCTKNSTSVKDRGVHQRNTALEHIERHKLDGIVYFADDDNVYSLELFDNIREIRRFGTWPVAMLAQSKNKAVLEGPVCNGSAVIGWNTNEKSKILRRFHVDMSGFAFNSTILWDPKRWKRPTTEPIRQLDTVKEGFQETTFIEQVVEDESQMEGIPQDCSRIMNWHLHIEARDLVYPDGWLLPKNLDVVLPIK
ncbi:hypothetical protein DCAR_0418275 [Daucus carota subsp. sativus]|uniref:Glycosyltransferases n=1 Tax=Daucus carota subsp. sativus TaxID=79200 RepID=A0A165ZA95_DAUCS|nr:PREDICTED: probable beta-1,4-xylosyltransferase IRX9H [Daucus carota subsp. sativus]WOG98929.1 hypothetical protein DCAR_0418275 [Daucus carota subsp. sativus]